MTQPAISSEAAPERSWVQTVEPYCNFFWDHLTTQILYRIDLLARCIILLAGSCCLFVKSIATFSLSLITFNQLQNYSENTSFALSRKDFEMAIIFLSVSLIAFREGFFDPIRYYQTTDFSLFSLFFGTIHWIMFRPYWNTDPLLLF